MRQRRTIFYEMCVLNKKIECRMFVEKLKLNWKNSFSRCHSIFKLYRPYIIYYIIFKGDIISPCTYVRPSCKLRILAGSIRRRHKNVLTLIWKKSPFVLCYSQPFPAGINTLSILPVGGFFMKCTWWCVHLNFQLWPWQAQLLSLSIEKILMDMAYVRRTEYDYTWNNSVLVCLISS